MKADIARALGVSDSMVSRYARRGCPTHSIELAREWCDANLVPGLRKQARDTRLPPAETRRDGLSLDAVDLGALLLDAGEALAASIMFECGLPADRVSVAINSFSMVLSEALEARGDPENTLYMIGGPDLRDPAVRARVDARVAELRAELAEDV